jgi:hypothetical protein
LIAGKRGKGWYVGEYGLVGRETLSKKEEKSFPSYGVKSGIRK